MSKIIRINQLKTAIDFKDKKLVKKLEEFLNVPATAFEYRIVRKSIDARKKPELSLNYCIDISAPNISRIYNKLPKKQQNRCQLIEDIQYVFEYTDRIKNPSTRPVIIGAGPCGYFCGLYLARAGFKPIILEQGLDTGRRKAQVEHFWSTGELDEYSNVQFGEGGAGTFSDGKLNTSIKDKSGRIKEVLNIFVSFGASEDIIIDAHPHIGTDKLVDIMSAFGKEISTLGGEIQFDTRVISFIYQNGRITGVKTNRGDINSDIVILACGHSSRDLFRVLYDMNVSMEAKNFAVGFRVAHRQSIINNNQYGEEWGSKLPAAPYKLTYQAASGRAVFSFCMCPGGYIVNASSKKSMLCVNGMSYSGRDSGYANSAIIVSVTPNDFGTDSPLAGMEYQERLEKSVFNIGDGCIPVTTLGQLKASIAHNNCDISLEGADLPKDIYNELNSDENHVFKGKIKFCDLSSVIDEGVLKDFVESFEYFGRVITDFNKDNTIIAAIESRTSSPVRIIRDDAFEANIKGLFPAGEGAGYAGGIVSAAIDGIRVAEAICDRELKRIN